MRSILMLASMLAMTASGPALAIQKCTVDGKTVYQDARCDDKRETVGEGFKRNERTEAYHRYLDELARKGQGLVRREPVEQKPYPARESGPMIGPRSRAAEQARDERWAAAIREETEHRNAESAARLTRILDEAAKACDGDPKQKVVVGMSDAVFRTCTLHARFGGVTQVVAEKQDGLELRLYIFTNEPHRVYSVGGVVTAIK